MENEAVIAYLEHYTIPKLGETVQKDWLIFTGSTWRPVHDSVGMKVEFGVDLNVFRRPIVGIEPLIGLRLAKSLGYNGPDPIYEFLPAVEDGYEYIPVGQSTVQGDEWWNNNARSWFLDTKPSKIESHYSICRRKKNATAQATTASGDPTPKPRDPEITAAFSIPFKMGAVQHVADFRYRFPSSNANSNRQRWGAIIEPSVRRQAPEKGWFTVAGIEVWTEKGVQPDVYDVIRKVHENLYLELPEDSFKHEDNRIKQLTIYGPDQSDDVYLPGGRVDRIIDSCK